MLIDAGKNSEHHDASDEGADVGDELETISTIFCRTASAVSGHTRRPSQSRA